MSWLGKAVGAAIGYAVGGPLGAAIGAAIGHAADSAVEEGASGAPVPHVAVFDDDFARTLVVTPAVPPPDGAFCLVTCLDGEGRPIRGRGPYRTDAGLFFAGAPFADGVARVYVPFCALAAPAGHGRRRTFPVTVEVRCFAPPAAADGEPRLVAAARLGPSELPVCEWDPVRLVEPVIGLCMAVVRADGRVLRPEVATVRAVMEQAFNLKKSDLPALKRAMKAPVPRDLGAAAREAMRRLPGLQAEDLLDLLLRVALADDELHPAEARVIDAVGEALGYGPGPRRAPGGGAGAEERPGSDAERPPPDEPDPYAVLGVRPGASREEIDAAYRKKIAAYHPDRVAGLAPEFQALAHQKTVEINAAYARLTRP